MSKSYNRDYFLNRKLKWEKNHGKFIHDFMFTEFSNRILGQCNVALNNLQRQLDLEIARAKAEEARLDQKIDAETTRAKAEETRLDGKIDSESSRATAEEKRLDGKIDAETARATTEETRLDGKIDTEKTRLDGKIDAETARATGREKELNTSIDAIAQAHDAVNNLYMVNNTDSYTLNDKGRLVKNDQQTKLISKYNDTIMYVAQAINRLAKKVEDLEQTNA